MSDDVHGLIGAYALDALTAEERAEFEAHLAVCEECRAEAASLGDVASALGAATAVTPPSSLRAAVLAQAAVTPQAVPGETASSAPALASLDAKRRPRRPVKWVLAAASVLVLAAIGVGVGTAYQSRQDSLAMERDVMMVTTAPDAHTMPLSLGTAHLVMSSSMDGVAVMGQDAPMPADGMEYQLWVMMDDGSAVAGPVFMPASDGEFMTVMHAPMDGVAGFMVTEEPVGGSSKMTGDMVAEVHV